MKIEQRLDHGSYKLAPEQRLRNLQKIVDAEEKTIIKAMQPKQTFFVQGPICLSGDCKENVEKALSFIGYVDLMQPKCLSQIEYLNNSCETVQKLHSHFEYRLKFLKTVVARDFQIDEIYREVVKLTPHQLEQVSMFANLCDSRLKDFRTTCDILCDCINILTKACGCCGVEYSTEITEKAKQHLSVFQSYIYSLESQKVLFSTNLLKLQEMTNETFEVVTKCFDLAYTRKSKEPEDDEINRGHIVRIPISRLLH